MSNRPLDPDIDEPDPYFDDLDDSTTISTMIGKTTRTGMMIELLRRGRTTIGMRICPIPTNSIP